jgi:tRNA pseudouridine38/39 synthase
MRLGLVRAMEQSSKKSKVVKQFSMSSFVQRRVALKVAYLGWDYSGNTTMQSANLEDENTVEARLIEALIKIRLIESLESCKLSRCGRTDKGVSAWANVVALTVRSTLYGAGAAACTDPGLIIPQLEEGDKKKKDSSIEVDYCRAINKVLPEDVRVVAWSPVSDTFDARFNARARVYKYFFLRDGMDLERMRRAAKMLEGEHDFRNFCKIDLDNTKSWTRSILETSVEEVEGSRLVCVARIKGSAFLWHQIRYTMAVLFHIGRGLEEPSVIGELLNVARVAGRPEFAMASDVPLVLYQCEFDPGDVEWRFGPGREGVTNEFALYSQLHATYENLMMRASIVHDMMKEMEQPDYAERRRREQLMGNNGKYVPLLHRPRLASVEDKIAKGK